jgi:aldose 1-epimerase
MDLRHPRKIGEGMAEEFEQLTQALGYDHNWVLNGEVGTLHPAAKVFCEKTGITMEVETTLPGLQLFVSRFPAPGLKGKGNTPYIGRQGFCLETQFWPDSPNHPDYPQAILRKGETWAHRTVFRFK